MHTLYTTIRPRIDSVIDTNKYKMQINVLAVVTRFIIVEEVLLIGLFPRPRPVADVPKPNAIKVIGLLKTWS